ncbi:MAG: nucleotidyltransferase family protein [Bacteroidales bacterium]|nr:nucleotidyltransferase family protein [Bacteroidales bacterium]
MVTRSYIEKKLQKLKPYLSRKYNVSRIGYFGSFSRNEQTEESDIDILVEFSKPIGWDFFDLNDLLEKELGVKVDLVSTKALRKQLRDSILDQTRYV